VTLMVEHDLKLAAQEAETEEQKQVTAKAP
jgi:hypothetical protein